MPRRRDERSSEVPTYVTSRNSEAIREAEALMPSYFSELKYLRYTISDAMPTCRHLYLKRHPEDRSAIILSNFPAYLPTDVVKNMLTSFVETPIVDLSIQRSSADQTVQDNLKIGQLTILIKFAHAQGAVDSLNKCQFVGPLKASDFTPEDPSSLMKHMIETYRNKFCTPEQISQSVDEYMQSQDELTAQAKRDKRKLDEDENGWTTIKSKNSAPALKIKKKDVPLTGGLHKNKKQADLNFYGNHAKQTKQNQVRELQEKFEEDKKRIAYMKSRRREVNAEA